MSVWRRGNEIIILSDFNLSITMDSQQVDSSQLYLPPPGILSVPFAIPYGNCYFHQQF